MKGLMKQILALLLISTLAAEGQTNLSVLGINSFEGTSIALSNDIIISSGQTIGSTPALGFRVYKDYKVIKDFTNSLVGFTGGFINGRYYYTAAGISGLLTFDIINPTNPVLVASSGGGLGFCSDCIIKGNKLFLSCKAAGVHIFDISSPTAPIKLGTLDTPGLATTVTIISTNRIAVNDDSFVEIVDYSNPTNMVVLGSQAAAITGGNFVNSRYTNNTLVVAGQGQGNIFTLNVSDPANIIITSSNKGSAASGTIDVEIVGSNVFASVQDKGINLFYLTSSNTLTPLIYRWNVPSVLKEIMVDKYGNIVGANQQLGIAVLGTNILFDAIPSTNFIVYSGGCSNDVGMTNVVFEFSTNSANFSAAVWKQFPNCTNNFEPIDPTIHTNIPATYMRVRKVP